MATRSIISIPQPCHASWDAMTSTSTGRHCAACAKTVIDFTRKTDAEILAYLANAASSRACGRFTAHQLDRQLQPALPAAPSARWRAWLAAAVAVWGVRETVGISAKAQVPVQMQRKIGKPVIASNLQALRKPDFEGTSGGVIRGVVRDSATQAGLPGVTVLIKGSTTGTVTGQDGAFELALPTEYAEANGLMLRVSFIGYVNEERHIGVADARKLLEFTLRPDNRMMGEVVVVGGIHYQRPWPWHPRRFYYWTKYQLLRPFRR